MTPPQRWFTSRLAALRGAAARGATLVEYAMVASLLLVVSMVAIDGLTTAADGEVNNQAECVSDRPPPTGGDAGCEFAPTPSDLVTPDPSFVPPTTGSPVPFPDQYTISAGPSSANTTDGWTLILPVQVFREIQEPPTDPEGAPSILVRARIQMQDPANPSENLPDPGFTECTTDASGECDLEYAVPFDDVDEATMLIIDVESAPPPDDLPPIQTYTRS